MLNYARSKVQWRNNNNIAPRIGSLLIELAELTRTHLASLELGAAPPCIACDGGRQTYGECIIVIDVEFADKAHCITHV